MKKLITALAIVSVASMAQAAVIASWTSTSAQNISAAGTTVAETGGYGFGFEMVSGTGFVAGGTAGNNTISVSDARLADAAAAYAGGDYVYFTWDVAYTLTLNSIDGRYSRSAGGAQGAQWGTIISSTWTSIGTAISSIPTATAGLVPTTTTFTGVPALTSGQLALAVYSGTVSGNGAWFRFDSRPSSGTAQVTALSIDGTMTAVPEPATMALLGLGGLALALRRKMSK